MLISRGQAKVNVKNSDGRTPLHLAMTSNSIVLINTLIQSGAEVNAKDLSNRTSLMIAAHSGHYNLVKHLLLKNADKYAKDNKGQNAYDHAIIGRHVAVAELLGTGPGGSGTQSTQSKFGSAGGGTEVNTVNRDVELNNMFAVKSARKIVDEDQQSRQNQQNDQNFQNQQLPQKPVQQIRDADWGSSSESSHSSSDDEDFEQAQKITNHKQQGPAKQAADKFTLEDVLESETEISVLTKTNAESLNQQSNHNNALFRQPSTADVTTEMSLSKIKTSRKKICR